MSAHRTSHLVTQMRSRTRREAWQESCTHLSGVQPVALHRLLRQLVTVPGAGAARHLAPTSDLVLRDEDDADALRDDVALQLG